MRNWAVFQRQTDNTSRHIVVERASGDQLGIVVRGVVWPWVAYLPGGNVMAGVGMAGVGRTRQEAGEVLRQMAASTRPRSRNDEHQ